MKKEEPYCSICGSTNIAKDAFAVWDYEKQEMVLHSTYDNTKCLNPDCEADDSMEWREKDVVFALKLLSWDKPGARRFQYRADAEAAKKVVESVSELEVEIVEIDLLAPENTQPSSPATQDSELNKDTSRMEDPPQTGQFFLKWGYRSKDTSLEDAEQGDERFDSYDLAEQSANILRSSNPDLWVYVMQLRSE